MKILIVGFFTKSNMPYINLYEKVLKKCNIEYDIICFDRFKDSIPTVENNVYTFYSVMGTDKRKKIVPYLRFSRYVKQIIKENVYDKLIVLTTVPAILLGNILKKYKNRYIFDYRDYSFEKFKLYRKIVNHIVDGSSLTFLSSSGFYDFVDKKKNTFLVHNMSNENAVVNCAKDFTNHTIIGFVGLVRYYDINTKLIDAFKNETDYEIDYYGSMYDDCDLETYVVTNNISNVNLHGEYDNKEKPHIYSNISIINSIYSLKSPEVSRALPNRLYDAALFKKPIIVAENCYLAEIVKEYGLGLAIDTNLPPEAWRNQIKSYVDTFDKAIFEKNCNVFLRTVKHDQDMFDELVTHFCKG